MKKRYLIYLFIFAFSFIFFISDKVLAETSAGGYTIESYDIDMHVNENNTFDITEKITAYFDEPRHGIYRKIPLKNNIIRADGTKSNNRAKITNIQVSENYTTYKENGYEVIKIGDADTTLTESHTYTIKYTYDIGKDPLKDTDELYFNLIGGEWDTSIDNINFKITMPKSFDESLLGFTSGCAGNGTDNSDVSYYVDDNTINGFYFNTLNEGEALTVRLTLPEGYFVGARSNIELYPIVVIIFSLLCVIIAGGLWSKYGKDDTVVETIEFHPPEGFNSAEIGFLYKGSADTKDIISLLVYLADKGYLTIEETEGTGLFSKSKGFRISKVREYDGTNEYERLFFNGLFSGTKTSVTPSDLYDRFYRTLNRIKTIMNTKENKNRIFKLSANKKIKWLFFMIAAIFVFITTKPIIDYMDPFFLIFAYLFPAIGFTAIIISVLNIINIPKILGIIWGGMFGGIPMVIIVLPALVQNSMYCIMYAIGLICIVFIAFFVKIMPKRTSYGTQILGKIQGFKRFLETAEKTQLESLVAQNPQYFYNILPYTYALGVSSIWMKQFETIAMQAPDWYQSHNSFNMHNFNHFMENTMKTAQSSMSSSPSSSSGSSGGGGGVSGGGSGGGGGGSW